MATNSEFVQTRTWMVSAMFGIDPAAVTQIVDVFKKSVPPDGAFCGDNLLTFGRNLSFLDQREFMSAFFAAKPEQKELSLIWRLAVLYWGAKRTRRLGGDLVEAACYQGFTARVLYDALHLKDAAKTYWLYDSFEPIDGVTTLSGIAPDLYEKVRERFSDAPNVSVIKGRLPESLSLGVPDRIGFLHLDMNSARSEVETLEALFDRLVPGAAIVLDDYGWRDYRAQKEAEDKWFADRGLDVLELPTGQGLVIV